MALLKNEDTSTLITRFVSLDDKQELIRTEQQLLNGSMYIQRIGEPMKYYSVIAYVDRAGKVLLQQAEDTTALLKAEVKHGIYYGRITALSFSERMVCDWFKATATLAKEAGN